MTTFLTLKNLVYKSLGRDDNDEATVLIVPAVINYAITAVALIFKPPELISSNPVVISAGSKSVSLSSLDFIDLTKVYNETDSRELFFVPFENWDIIVPSGLTVVKFYSINGETLFVKGTPAADKTLTVYCIDYPTELTADDQPVDFEHYDSYIMAVASAIAFAAFEEGETVDVWAKVVEALGMSFLKGSAMREVIAGKQISLESTITGALAKQ